MGRGKKADASVAPTLSEAALHVREQLEQFGKSTEFLSLVDVFAFDEVAVKGLVELVSSNDSYPYPQYASHILLHIGRNHYERVDCWYETLLDTVLSTTNTSVKRNVLGALICAPLKPYRDGELLDWLFAVLNDPDSKPGHINYAVKKLAQYLKVYPELEKEIELALELREELSGRSGWVEWGKWIMKPKSSKQQSKPHTQ